MASVSCVTDNTKSVTAIRRWLPLATAEELNLDTTLRSGQAFRWKKNERNEWTGVVGGDVVYLAQHDNEVRFCANPHRRLAVAASESVEESSPSASAPDSGSDAAESETLLRAKLGDYFQLHVRLDALCDSWTSSDPRLRSQLEGAVYRGLRLLRQEPLECFFSFVCSQNNNIARITKMLDALCERYGQCLGEADGHRFHAFPTLERLSRIPEEELRALGFGYRAKYFATAARQMLEKGDDWLAGLRAVPRDEVQKELLAFMGVGKKVADCIGLFSLDKFDIIPVDTHVWQIAQSYMPQLKNKKLNDRAYQEIGDFFRKLLGSYAGWAHTLLFAAELNVFKAAAASAPSPSSKRKPSGKSSASVAGDVTASGVKKKRKGSA